MNGGWLMGLQSYLLPAGMLAAGGAAVLVTPAVVLLAIHARIPPLPFALTTIWLANTESLLLPVSLLCCSSRARAPEPRMR